MTDPADLLTVTDIVEEYGVSRKTIQRWVLEGKIVPTMKLTGKTGAHLFTRKVADSAFKNHRNRKAADPSFRWVPEPVQETLPVDVFDDHDDDDEYEPPAVK